MDIRVVIADDERCIREGLRMSLSLEPGIAVVGEAADGLEALRMAYDLRPDVVVMDVVMPKLDGLLAAEALRTLAPESAVVVLSMYDNPNARTRAREAQASAFVAKDEGVPALIAAIRQAVI